MQTATHHYVQVSIRPLHHRFASHEDSNGEGIHGKSSGPTPARGEDLPYKVEVWNADRSMIEQTLAMTTNASIGYAAYYEATKEYPDQYVTLRHKTRIVARWNPPED